MRIVLATDGSAGSTIAAEFVAANFAPDEPTTVHVVTVDEWSDAGDSAGAAENLGPAEPPEGSPLRSATDVLRRHAFSTSATVLRDRPEQGITGFASAAGVDLIVVGSRGLHGWRRLVAGSVSSGVARASTVPVLVAASAARVGRVIVGYDGSGAARTALLAAVRLPFARVPEFVVCVAYEAMPPLASGMAPTMLAAAEEAYAADLAAAEQAARETAREGVSVLAAAGTTASPFVGHGPPSGVLLDLAARDIPSLIVVGDRGRSVLKRMVLGSTSAALLRAGHVDVLVAHAMPSPA